MADVYERIRKLRTVADPKSNATASEQATAGRLADELEREFGAAPPPVVEVPRERRIGVEPPPGPEAPKHWASNTMMPRAVMRQPPPEPHWVDDSGMARAYKCRNGSATASWGFGDTRRAPT